MDEHQRTILIDAANEAFAGMRAYHTSEITHKQQTVSTLTTVLAGNGALVAASFGALDHAEAIGWPVLCASAVGIFVSTFFFAMIIVTATIGKMNADAARYQEFKAQSIRARSLLGLYHPMTTDYGTATVLPPVKESTGVQKTQETIWAFFWMVIIFSLAGWAAVSATWYAALV